MKIAASMVLGMLFLFCPLGLAQKVNAVESDKKEIESLEEQRNRAILSGDAAALERMTADDYTFITLRGELRTKAEIVKGSSRGLSNMNHEQSPI
jgi:ketosteroid isomerase-like protein